MAKNTENHTIQLLREMRKEMKEGFNEVNLRIDGLTYITTMLAGNMGGHDQRLDELEAAIKDLQKT
ncbi:hypothetical protein [Roseovarius phycicola]|uniref:Uncharacterized protein n=1 Tax=Roseovarius phycicola TaxID=3080976 RepID=A0ABZ2HCT1_9RHOB